MKLYNGNLSPYATRARVYIRMKGIDCEIAPPPARLRTDDILKIFPLGKIPVLELDDGTHIPDSWVIINYLEDTIPEPVLRPSDPSEKAEMELIARYADTYLAPALFPLFRALSNMPDEDGKAAMIGTLKADLAKFDALLTTITHVSERDIHMGDIALAPNLFFVMALTPMFGENDLLADFDNVREWWGLVSEHPEIKRGNDEIAAAYKAMMAPK